MLWHKNFCTMCWHLRNNISSSLPGYLSQHAHPSLAPSGDANSPWFVHVAWDAYDSQCGSRVIIHRFASTADWNFGSQYHELHYQIEDRPSISGLAGNTAHMVYNRGTNFYHLNAHFNGSSWSVQFPAINGFYPSLSAGYPAAKYVWTDGAGSPYTVNLSTSTFSKTTGSAPPTVEYHRSVAIVDPAKSAWFEVRVEGMVVKTAAGATEKIDFAKVDSSLAFTPANAFNALASQIITVPATTESLTVHYAISGDNLSVVKNASSLLRVELTMAEPSGNATSVLVFTTNVENLPKQDLNIALAASAFVGKTITLTTEVNGISANAGLVATLGHIYEFVEAPPAQNLSKEIKMAAPKDFLTAYPNPFNPSTQIRFTMREAGIATLRIYNLNGQAIRELLNEYRNVGKHRITWDGRDDRGRAAASGVYFIRFAAESDVKVEKLMLVQ
jgi:hypothetical protein